MANKLWLVLLLPVFAASCNARPEPVAPVTRYLQVGNAIVQVEVADSADSRRVGLSGRQSLGSNAGMLFIFPESGFHGFWMKDTFIPLDFIWIADNRVVEITSNVGIELGVSDGELTQYIPKQAVDSMLEVNAGWAVASGVKVGDGVVFADAGERP